MGKIRTEGVGEVQEFIDIVSLAPPSRDVVGLILVIVRLRNWFVQDDEWACDKF